MNAKGLRIGLVGPLPPPSGGMANQTRQLARLLEQERVEVEIVQVNAPYRPHWVGSLRGVRALFRLAPFLVRLWHAAGRVQLFHVMANSGWAWHLCAAPAIPEQTKKDKPKAKAQERAKAAAGGDAAAPASAPAAAEAKPA